MAEKSERYSYHSDGHLNWLTFATLLPWQRSANAWSFCLCVAVVLMQGRHDSHGALLHETFNKQEQESRDPLVALAASGNAGQPDAGARVLQLSDASLDPLSTSEGPDFLGKPAGEKEGCIVGGSRLGCACPQLSFHVTFKLT